MRNYARFVLMIAALGPVGAAQAQGSPSIPPPNVTPDSAFAAEASLAPGPYSRQAFLALRVLSDTAPAAPDIDIGAGPDGANGAKGTNETYGGYGVPDYSGVAGNPGTLFFDLRAATPFDDFQMGGRVGFSVGSRIAADFFLDMETRPYRRAVRIQESETLEYQYREERFTFGPGVLARVPLNPGVALVAGGGAGLSPAWYRGSNREAPSAGLGWLETGIRFITPSGVDWGFSYQFFPLPGVSPHRISFQMGRRIHSR
jgi:hypothetical protein